MSVTLSGTSAFENAAREGLPASRARKYFGGISHHGYMRLAIEHRIGFWRLPNGRLVYAKSDVERVAEMLAAQLPAARDAPR